MIAPEIKKLQQSVVNRIAAGEVVQRPSAAIKEMLENSVDAGSTIISVISKSGGLDLLQIQDNGHGIRKEDLPILCERFTTSKLRTYEDLRSIKTFGFRGEALASISYVSHVTVTTKTSGSQCAFKAKYLDGQLVPIQGGNGSKAEPKPCAGMNGTIITVENLFYNLPSRKSAFRDQHEQYQYILDVVSKYSIHYGDRGISFACKRHNQNTPDTYTPVDSSIANNIKIVYGQSVANSLISINISSDSIHSDDTAMQLDSSLSSSNILAMSSSSSSSSSQTALKSITNPTDINENSSEYKISFEIKGYVSNANYSNKKTTLVLFINNRLVESHAIKKIVDSVYLEILPKHAHPFAYLSLTMPSENVDVNVHPTKKEVHFLFEDKILECLYLQLRQVLIGSNQSRTFQSMAVLSSQSPFMFPTKQQEEVSIAHTEVTEPPPTASDAIIAMETEFLPILSSSQLVYSDSSPNHVDESVRMGAGDTNDVAIDQENTESSDNITSVHAASQELFSRDEQTSLLPSHSVDLPRSSSNINISSDSKSNKNTNSNNNSSSSSISVPAHKYVRTDTSSQRLDAFFRPVVVPKPAAVRTTSSTTGSVNRIELVDTNNNAQFATTIESFDEELSTACPCCPVPSLQLNPDVPYCMTATNKKRKQMQPSESGNVVDHVVDPDFNSDILSQSYLQSQSQSEKNQAITRAFKVVDSQCDHPIVQNKRNAIYRNQQANILHLLRNHSPVGIIDQTSSLWQFNTKLLLVNHHILTVLLFRQLIIRQLGQTLSVLQIPSDQFIDIRKCILAVVIDDMTHKKDLNINNSVNKSHEVVEEEASIVCDKACAVLMDYADILKKYFKIGIQVNDCSLFCLPDLLPGYFPDQSFLPRFLFQLSARLYAVKRMDSTTVSATTTATTTATTAATTAATTTATTATATTNSELSDVPETEHTSSKTSKELTEDILEVITTELSIYYARLPSQPLITGIKNADNTNTNSDDNIDNVDNKIYYKLSDEGENYFNHIIYPTIKTSLLPDSTLTEKKVFIPIATLEKLYKVFERC